MMGIWDALLQIVMGILGTFGFSAMFGLRGRNLLLASLSGGLTWSVYLLLGGILPSVPWRYFVCACVGGVFAEILARVLKTPATTFLISTIIPHIPGGALYQTMRYALDKQWQACLYQAFYTFRLALALALGFVVVLAVFNAMTAVGQGAADGEDDYV